MTVYCLSECYNEGYVLRNVFTNLQDAKDFINLEWTKHSYDSVVWLTQGDYPWKIEEFPLLGEAQ